MPSIVMGDRDSDVIRRTVQLLLPRGGVEQARQLFDYLERQKSPILGEMNQEYVYVKVFTGDIAEAEKDVEKSVAAGSKDYRDYLRQGQLYGVLAQRLRNQGAGCQPRMEIRRGNAAAGAAGGRLPGQGRNLESPGG